MAASADLRIFLDSNVIISGIYSPDGPPAKILNLHANAKLRIIVCQLTIEEVVRTIREKRPDALPALQLFLTNAPPEIIKNPPLKEVRRWIDLLHFEDAVILAAALSAAPDYFVTGDRHFHSHPSLAEKSGLRIITPAQMLRIVAK
ncbi:MAG: PIN domain-containing protein [Dehalococcoidia bacterium]